MRPFAILLLATLAVAQDEGEAPEWKILRYKPFEVEPVDSTAAAKALIDRLVELGAQRDGLQGHSGGGTYLSLTDDPFGRLVRMGPAALSALLAHLDDARKTKLVFPDHVDGMGAVLLYPEVIVPPGRSAEAKRIRAAAPGVAVTNTIDLDRKRLEGHHVTVGDCCFAIIGQIVNRSYEAVRYQPSIITAVCSPTVEPAIAKAVRAAWGGVDLARSLQDDYYTRGPGSGFLQAGAAARLCLYYPKQAGEMVAQRIAKLTFEYEDHDWMLRQALETGCEPVRKVWLKLLDPAQPPRVQSAALFAIRGPPDAEAQARIKAILEETKNTEIMLDCLARLPPQGERMFARLERTLRLAEARDEDTYWTCRNLIEAMIRIDKKRGFRACREYMAIGHKRKLIVLGALNQVNDRELALALLPPLLDDKTPQKRAMYLERVCDYAAKVLAQSVEELKFTNGTRAERDREIATMRAALKR